ncbi:hypothetical protein MIMGU_mgv1a026643mg, partial [Erythranthe guttata]
FTCWFNAKSIEAFGTFGFDIHHRYSDVVKEYLNEVGMPENDTVDYYTAMAHRDHLFNGGRRLAASTTPPPLTFMGGNGTYRRSTLGIISLFLLKLTIRHVAQCSSLFIKISHRVLLICSVHYSFVRVGTPYLEFLVAIDTSSDLFWLPCDCPNCARYYNGSDGNKYDLPIYSPSNSTSSKLVPCNSPMCGPTRGCSTTLKACSYQIGNVNATSSTGILVDDILHLGTDTNPQDPVDVSVTFGCGKNQTGNYLTYRGLNGVFGLGMDSISVPSILASKNLVANSFSLCFITARTGRIEFGDKGTAEQKTTPFNVQKSNPTYNITVKKIAVDNNATDLEFSATLKSSVPFTYLSEPAYSFITDNLVCFFESSFLPHDLYIFPCSANQSSPITPNLTFTMKGGDQFNVILPTILFQEDDGLVYCLAIVQTEGINIIGQIFMTGHRLVFDREEMVLGWEESNCDYSSPIIIPPTRPRAPPKQPPPSPPPPSGDARSSSITSGLTAVILAIFFHHFIVLSS